MYEELIKRLRNVSMEFGQLDHVSVLLLEAADAIEEMQATVDGLTAQTNMVLEETGGRTVIKFEPKWIPVTERLPEKHEWVLVKSKFVKMKTDFISNDGHWYSTTAVTHWMPLPEPPKEET